MRGIGIGMRNTPRGERTPPPRILPHTPHTPLTSRLRWKINNKKPQRWTLIRNGLLGVLGLAAALYLCHPPNLGNHFTYPYGASASVTVPLALPHQRLPVYQALDVDLPRTSLDVQVARSFTYTTTAPTPTPTPTPTPAPTPTPRVGLLVAGAPNRAVSFPPHHRPRRPPFLTSTNTSAWGVAYDPIGALLQATPPHEALPGGVKLIVAIASTLQVIRWNKTHERFPAISSPFFLHTHMHIYIYRCSSTFCNLIVIRCDPGCRRSPR